MAWAQSSVEYKKVSQSDKEILRDLGRKVFEIATSKANEEIC